ncbi:MAG: 50S ribosomal protein L19 [Candidatus Omnitrophica bacterium]|nr:50S ribosomal protein L19 [Candidatus Omnitrophota bacterium]
MTQTHRKSSLPTFKSGDEVRVWCRIMERDRVRVVPFEGVVIRRRGAGFSQTCTVRRITHGEGVERVFPLHAPVVERIELLRRTKVRRARLYFLRRRVGKTRFADADTAEAASAGKGRGTDAPHGTRGLEAQPPTEPEPPVESSQPQTPSSSRS